MNQIALCQQVRWSRAVGRLTPREEQARHRHRKGSTGSRSRPAKIAIPASKKASTLRHQHRVTEPIRGIDVAEIGLPNVLVDS